MAIGPVVSFTRIRIGISIIVLDAKGLLCYNITEMLV